MSHFGHIASIEVGDVFENRSVLKDACLHLPTQAEISGGENEGAYSIVLCGRYEDDEDFGNEIIQSRHQNLLC
ncbi:hypothetical protein J4N45_21890 [Vibrio sp. SCSIO 43140]|nr:hypothetical protein J4N45_21890 [Vibrio sp. SCSIO 43140]